MYNDELSGSFLKLCFAFLVVAGAYFYMFMPPAIIVNVETGETHQNTVGQQVKYGVERGVSYFSARIASQDPIPQVIDVRDQIVQLTNQNPYANDGLQPIGVVIHHTVGKFPSPYGD